MQTRDLLLADAQLKFSRGGSAMAFEGYASVFGGVDSYGDTIVKGAYLDTLKDRKRPVIMLYGHNPGRPIGKWIDLEEDDKGLRVKGEMTPGNTEAENAYASAKHGALSGLSIGFRVPTGGSEETNDGRLLKKIDLIEISLVSMPADADAQIDSTSIKSSIEASTSLKEIGTILRDAGQFSKSSADALISRIKSIVQGDPEELANLKRKVDALTAELAQHRSREMIGRIWTPTT